MIVTPHNGATTAATARRGFAIILDNLRRFVTDQPLAQPRGQGRRLLMPEVALRVLIAPDKFRGSLTAQHAAEIIADGIHTVLPAAECELKPIADGGEAR